MRPGGGSSKVEAGVEWLACEILATVLTLHRHRGSRRGITADSPPIRTGDSSTMPSLTDRQQPRCTPLARPVGDVVVPVQVGFALDR